MTRTPIRPYLINKDEEGQIRLTIRETRFNSQRYPLVTSTLQDGVFKTVTAARTYVKEHFGATAADIATK